MKIPNWLITLLLIVGGGLIGLVIAFYVAVNPPPPIWNNLDIPLKRTDVVDILFVDHGDFTGETINDTVYVKTESGDLYSLLHNEWKLLPSLPNGDIAIKFGLRDGYADSPIIAVTDDNKVYQLIGTEWELMQNYEEFSWGTAIDGCENLLPNSTDVIDSEGVEFEHAIAAFDKCYVLYKDGSLAVWNSSASGLAIIGLAPFYCVIGSIAGSILNLILWLYRKFRFTKELYDI